MVTIKNYHGITFTLYEVQVLYKKVWNHAKIDDEMYFSYYQFVGYHGLKESLKFIQSIKKDFSNEFCTTYIESVKVQEVMVFGNYGKY